MPDINSPVTTAKNFLTSSERQLGWGVYAIGGGALAVAAFAFKAAILSAISFGITVVGGTIMLAIGAVVALWLWMTLLSPRFWTEMRLANYQFVRWVSSMLMKANPFGRMRAFANEYLQAQWDNFNAAAVRVESQRTEVSRKLSKDQDALRSSKSETAAIEQRHRKADGTWDDEQLHDKFRLEAQRILFLEDAIKKGDARLQRLTMLTGVLDKWRNTLRFEIDMTRMTADYLEQDFNAANETTNALSAASSAFGHGDAAQADKDVREYIERLTSDRMARADVLMKQIPELTAVGELRGDAAEDEILRRLKNFDTDAQKALVEVQEDQRQISAGATPAIDTLVRAKEAVPARRFLK